MIKVNLLGETEPAAGTVSTLNPATRQVLAFAISAGVTLAITGLFYFSWGRDIQRQQAALQRQQVRQRALAAIQSQNQRYEHELKELQARSQIIQKLEESRRGPADLMTGLGDVVNQTKDLYLLRISPASQVLHIQGEARTVSAISAFMNALKSSSGFSDVHLKRYYQDDQHDRTNFRFNLDCVYQRSGVKEFGTTLRSGGS